MNSIKCDRCGLANLVSFTSCRHCGYALNQGPASQPFERATPVRASKEFSYFPYVAKALVAGLIFFVGYGIYRSISNVKVQDDNRIAIQKQQEADSMRSRQQIDQERMAEMKLRMGNLTFPDPKKQQEQVQKAIQPTLDKLQKDNERIKEIKAESDAMKQRSLPPPPR